MDPLHIEELKFIQRQRRLGHVHLVDVQYVGYTCAHTDAERAELEALQQAGKDENPLLKCPLHLWLLSQDGPPVAPGIYIVEPQDDDPVAPWTFTAFEDR